jgi:hypothetical protein
MCVIPFPARSLLGAALAATALLAAGCSRGPQFAQVEGIVTLDGKPLADVEVVFLPDPEKGNFGPHSTAYTDEDGRFRMYCEKSAAAGVVLGPQRVIIRDITTLPDPPGARGEPKPPPPKSNPSRVPRFPLTYALPAQTPFRDIEINPGPQTFTFDVKSGKRRT